MIGVRTRTVGCCPSQKPRLRETSRASAESGAHAKSDSEYYWLGRWLPTQEQQAVISSAASEAE